MRRLALPFARRLFLLLTLLLVGGAAAASQSTGLPLPRFISLAATETNVRTGPAGDLPHPLGLHAPRRAGADRRGIARLAAIVDHEGDTGWIHASLLSSRRTILVTGDVRPLRAPPRSMRGSCCWPSPW
ncbi:MAG: hypothetical protein R3D25_18335 [Geminicoccaceae bacterium]